MKWKQKSLTHSPRSSLPLLRSGLLESVLHAAIILFGMSLIVLVLLISDATATKNPWNEMRGLYPDLSNGSPLSLEKYRQTINYVMSTDCIYIACEDAVSQKLAHVGGPGGVIGCT